jgi:membrane protein implicated in regulation of membrane protease activity
MAFILGVFDLLAYAIPGSLYLAVFGYAAQRAGWIDVPSLLQLPSVLLLIALAVAAFLAGQAAYPLGSWIDRVNRFGSTRLPEEAKEDFLRRNATAAGRRFLQVDPFTLLAALESESSEAAAEVSRLRATGLMLSRSVPALLLGVVTALVEIFTGGVPLFAALTGLVLALVAGGCLYQSSTFRRWAIIRTYELSFWNDEIDGRLPDEQQR